MRFKLSYVLIGSLIALGTLPAAAGTVVDVYPNTTALSDTQGSVVGNPQSAPGFGDGGSWQATGVKSNYYITPQALFGRDVLVSEVSSMTYWTNQNGNLGSNWNLYIYTTPTVSDNFRWWYKSKLAGSAPDGPAGWDQQSTTTVSWSDPDRNSTAYTTDITWAAITTHTVTWPTSNASRDYHNETVEFFSLQTGSTAHTLGLVDGLQINLQDGTAGAVNFEAAPEPATWSLFAIGAGLLGLTKRYRR